MTYYLHHSPFHKHLYNLGARGFYARKLDPDDEDFIRRVRERGIANGEEPHSDFVSVEELEFWGAPYTIQPGVQRRAGPYDRTPKFEERRAARLARQAMWRARYAERVQDRKIAAAELERAEREWAELHETRRHWNALTDAEWDAAAPPTTIDFGAVVDQHYVPQWKLDEAREHRKVLQERERVQLSKYEKQQQKALRAKLDADRRQRELEFEKEQLIEARKQAEEMGNLILERIRAEVDDPFNLKKSIMTVMRQSRVPWTIAMLARATGCEDEAAIRAALEDLVRENHLKGTIE